MTDQITVPSASVRFRSALRTLAQPDQTYTDFDGVSASLHTDAWDYLDANYPDILERMNNDFRWADEQGLIKLPFAQWMGACHFERDYLNWAEAYYR